MNTGIKNIFKIAAFGLLGVATSCGNSAEKRIKKVPLINDLIVNVDTIKNTVGFSLIEEDIITHHTTREDFVLLPLEEYEDGGIKDINLRTSYDTKITDKEFLYKKYPFSEAVTNRLLSISTGPDDEQLFQFEDQATKIYLEGKLAEAAKEMQKKTGKQLVEIIQKPSQEDLEYARYHINPLSKGLK